MNEMLPVINIVDDDESVRKSLKRLLKSVGLSAQTFSSSEEFLQSGLQEKIGCLILDIRMPGLNGLELQKQLIDKGSKVPVIFMTAHEDDLVRDIALDSGAIAFLYKPFDEKALLEAVSNGLGININFSEAGLS